MTKKITELLAMTTATSGDLIPIVDIEGNVTQKAAPAALAAAVVGATPNNTLTASMLATTAITLGYAQATTTQTVSVNTVTDLTNLSVTVTVPAGGRRCKITGYLPTATTGAANNAVTFSIREGTTTLATNRFNVDVGKNVPGLTVLYSEVLSAGSHTYKLSITQDVTSGVDYVMAAISRGFILVEAI